MKVVIKINKVEKFYHTQRQHTTACEWNDQDLKYIQRLLK